MYLWPVRDDGENHHNIVNNYPSVTKKSASRRSSVTPAFTPTPVPTGSLSCFRGNGQVVGSLYGLSPGPPRGPERELSLQPTPVCCPREHVGWTPWPGVQGIVLAAVPSYLGLCSGRPRERVPGAQPAIPLCWALPPLKSPLVSPGRPWLLQEPPVGNPSPLPLSSVAPGPGLTPLMPDLRPTPPFSFIRSTSTYHPPPT